MQEVIIKYNCIFSKIWINHIIQLLKSERIVVQVTAHKMKPIDVLTWCVRNVVSYTCKCQRYLPQLFQLLHKLRLRYDSVLAKNSFRALTMITKENIMLYMLKEKIILYIN